METRVDDIGSFPLPPYAKREKFDKAYATARKMIFEGKNLRENDFVCKNFYEVVVDSFEKKLKSGLDVANYPQHYDMCKQFTDVIHKAMENGTYIVNNEMAVIPEVHVILQEAKRICENTGQKIPLRVCVTGPVELYLTEIGPIVYKDVLLMFAETVKRFAKNAVINTKHVKTEVIALDEPSFGLREINTDKETLIKVFEKAFDFSGVVKQIHTHAPSRIPELLKVKNLDVVSIEYAASPRNIEYVNKRMLEDSDKQIRVGIARTDFNNIIAELYERGLANAAADQISEDEEKILRRFIEAKEKFGERLTFTGPDCGLGGWPNQEVAQLILKRTVNAVKSTAKRFDF